ncbi:MAG: DHH family phosphoesterase, partial [Blautia massiliensis (ex Durand et al. 2017)]
MTQSVDHETVVSRLLGADDILILCHKNPDGDTIGSGAALCLALQRLGKTAAVLCSDPIPAMYH